MTSFYICAIFNSYEDAESYNQACLSMIKTDKNTTDWCKPNQRPDSKWWVIAHPDTYTWAGICFEEFNPLWFGDEEF